MLAFARKGIPYSRIQIDEPPGLTGLAGQQSINGGVPAPSLEYFQRKLGQQTQSVKRWRYFQDAYGNYNHRTRTLTFNTTGEKAARDLAKARVVGRESQVGDVALLQLPAFVMTLKLSLCVVWDSAQFQFDLQTFLVNFFG